MKDSNSEILKTHPMIIFWIGLLTGALVVGLIFLYRFMNPGQFESSLFRSYTVPQTTISPTRIISPTTTISPTQTISPTTTISPIELNSFPTPTGG